MSPYIWKQALGRGPVISKQQLRATLYSDSDEVEGNTVAVHVHRLRRRLGRQLIKTMHGMGYMIDARGLSA